MNQSIQHTNKKRLFSKWFWAMPLLSLMMAACSKEAENPPLAFVPIPHEVKSTFYHKTGSYWIYEENFTGFVDSVYVVSATFDTTDVIHPGNLTPIGKLERFKMRVKSSFYGNEVEISSEADYLAASFRPNEPHHWVTYQTFTSQNVPEWASHLFIWPFITGKTESAYRFLGPVQSWSVTRIDQGFSLRGLTYDTVYTTITKLDLTRQAQEVHRQIAVGVGEIRRNSVNHGIDWQLIRHYSQP